MFAIDMANVSPVPLSNWINKAFEKYPFDRDKSNFNISVLSSIHSSGSTCRLSLTQFLQIPDRSVSYCQLISFKCVFNLLHLLQINPLILTLKSLITP